ncbi:MAG: hypothetical protein QG553_448 [Patescibacteria group bacterium]|nr:hypothetical protein [Patescibacteria group bacterium]
MITIMKTAKSITHEDLYQMIQKNSKEIQDIASLLKDFIDMVSERFDALEKRVAVRDIQFEKHIERFDHMQLRQQNADSKVTHVEKFLSRKRYLPQLKPVTE